MFMIPKFLTPRIKKCFWKNGKSDYQMRNASFVPVLPARPANKKNAFEMTQSSSGGDGMTTLHFRSSESNIRKGGQARTSPVLLGPNMFAFYANVYKPHKPRPVSFGQKKIVKTYAK